MEKVFEKDNQRSGKGLSNNSNEAFGESCKEAKRGMIEQQSMLQESNSEELSASPEKQTQYILFRNHIQSMGNCCSLKNSQKPVLLLSPYSSNPHSHRRCICFILGSCRVHYLLLIYSFTTTTRTIDRPAFTAVFFPIHIAHDCLSSSFFFVSFRSKMYFLAVRKCNNRKRNHKIE